MDHAVIIRALAANGETFRALLEKIPAEEYRWKPSPEKWSILEVLCHLCDEEREDFRARVKHTLETPELPLSPIDPAGWVTQRNYAARDYTEMLDLFIRERKNSAGWLGSLSAPNWKNTHRHPKLGAMTAELFLANWLAHDYLHIRQVTSLRFHYLMQHSGEDLRYAGEW